MPDKPSIPVLDEKSEQFMASFAYKLSYLTLAIGYLLAVLTGSHLTIFNLLILTVLQVVYCFALWGITRFDPTGWRLVANMSLLVIITSGIGLLPFIGVGWDWLAYLVTLSIGVIYFSGWGAVCFTILLYVIAGLNLALLDKWHWSQMGSMLASLIPAFAFVAIFSFGMRILEIQKARAELLLHRLEESNAELEQAHRQLQEYASQVEELTIVRERNRVAREIRDTLGHYLSILNIQLETISKLQERDPARAISEVAEARRVAAQSMQEVRNAINALRPTSMASLNLSEAIARLGSDFEHTSDGVELVMDLETELPSLSPDIQVALFRAAQEALTNIRKHAQASKVLMRLRYENEEMELVILDNGKELPDAERKRTGGFGLIGLRERMALLGGKVSYGLAEQGGFRVSVRIPVPSPVQSSQDSEMPALS